MHNEQFEQLIDTLAKAANDVEMPAGYLSGKYEWSELEHLPANKEYAQDIAKAVVLALATSYDLGSVTQLFDILEMNRGKR